ncbi:MAG TPA: hypothetical protein VGJ45_35635 [Pseudonocardiaceae bacterium]
MTAEAQGPIADATETAVELSTDEQPPGPLPRRLNRRSPPRPDLSVPWAGHARLPIARKG